MFCHYGNVAYRFKFSIRPGGGEFDRKKPGMAARSALKGGGIDMANRNIQGFPIPEEDSRFTTPISFYANTEMQLSLKVVVHQMEHQFKLQYDNDIDKFLDSVYAAKANLTRNDSEQRAKSIARNNQMLKL